MYVIFTEIPMNIPYDNLFEISVCLRLWINRLTELRYG